MVGGIALQNDTYACSFAVFPFLKTSAPVHLPGITLYSTEDTAHLGPEDAKHVATIAAMLFLKDNLRIPTSGTYVRVPFIDLDHPERAPKQLERLQAIIAYCYAAPHPASGDPFFAYEHASLAIFSPKPVSIYLVRPEHHTTAVTAEPLSPNHRGEVRGYHGLYNFQHHFWVTAGSRLYPPVPDITLNIAQDLAADVGQFIHQSLSYQFLPSLLAGTDTITSRVLTAIQWFNKATTLGGDEETSILHLAVAFEALLGLPEDQKTDRLTDAIALLLGRIPRLDSWGRQFYKARSEIVHEGQARQLRFMTDPKRPQEAHLYNSLLSFGRQVFQLSASTLLFGARLSAAAGLEEKLVTNQERFEQLCTILADQNVSAADRLQRISAQAAAIARYCFVAESNLRIETMLGTVRLAAHALIAADTGLPALFAEHLEKLAKAQRSPDEYESLAAVHALHDMKRSSDLSSVVVPARGLVIQLVDVIWHSTFMHYFWLKQRHDNTSASVGFVQDTRE